MDTILAVAAKHRIPVVEDACQAHLAEWKGKKVGGLGQAGCFSFQASKNLNSGEGGAIVTNDSALMDRAISFHNNGRGTGAVSGYVRNGSNHRMTEFQAALLSTQLSRLVEQSDVRWNNAKYLTKQLEQIPGIHPARMYAGTTRNAYHLYMFRFDSEQFSGLARAQFLKALQAEGIPCYGGYTPLNKEAFLENTLQSRAYQKIYSRGGIERVPGTESLSGERSVVRAGGLVRPDHAAGARERYGRYRERDSQNPEARRESSNKVLV